MLIPALRSIATTVSSRKGVTAAEYAVMAAALVIAVGVAVNAFGAALLVRMSALLP